MEFIVTHITSLSGISCDIEIPMHVSLSHCPFICHVTCVIVRY